MDFLNFLNQFKKSLDLHSSIIFFSGKKYSNLFFSQLYKHLKINFSVTSTFLDMKVLTIGELKTKLELSFLGKSTFYFLKDFSSLNIAKKRDFFKYFSEYKGPNVIVFFSSETSSLLDHISLPDKIDINLYQEIYTFFYPDIPFSKLFVKKLFSNKSNYGLDDACALMSYQSLLHTKSEDFFSLWLEKIVVPEKSLFILSQLFLEKKTKEFFEYWNIYKKNYPEEFWISFWSEQIWQSVLFLLRVKDSGLLQAKKEAYRLPFSFMNKDWKNYNIKFLINSHAALYQLDFDFKNGKKTNSIELWFYKFLLNKFNSN